MNMKKILMLGGGILQKMYMEYGKNIVLLNYAFCKQDL